MQLQETFLFYPLPAQEFNMQEAISGNTADTVSKVYFWGFLLVSKFPSLYYPKTQILDKTSSSVVKHKTPKCQAKEPVARLRPEHWYIEPDSTL